MRSSLTEDDFTRLWSGSNCNDNWDSLVADLAAETTKQEILTELKWLYKHGGILEQAISHIERL